MLLLMWITLGAQAQAQTQTAIVVNPYSPVTEARLCRNWLRFDTTYAGVGPADFQVGDTVIIIQMQGASADASGSITSMGAAGRFERNVIARRSADTVFLSMTMLASYTEKGTLQIVQSRRFPSAAEVGADDTTRRYSLSAPPFDGRAGGVLMLHSADTIRLWCNITADGCGFRNDEGICTIGTSVNAGKQGTLGSGGGGHGGRGGQGTRNAQGVGASGGQALSYTSGVNWIFMGGGSGSVPNGTSTAGGGIVIVDAPAIHGNGFAITARGDSGTTPTMGGGAGGALLLTSKTILDVPLCSVVGGNSQRGGAGGGGVVRIGTITALNLTASSYRGGLASENATGNGEGGKLFYNVIINEGTQRYSAPQPVVSADTSVCVGRTVSLWGRGAEVVAWTRGADTLCTACDSVDVVADSTQTLSAHFMINGCVDTMNVTVTVYPTPNIQLPDTVYTCPAVPITVAAQEGFARYAWSTGDTTTHTTLRAEGTYYLDVVSTDGCGGRDSVVLMFTSEVRMRVVSSGTNGVVLSPLSPSEQGQATITIENITDTALTITAVRLHDGTVLSVPLHQLPRSLPPHSMTGLNVVGAYHMPGNYSDTLSVFDECGVVSTPLTVTITETPWFTRCKVRITSSGELEGFTPEQLQEVVIVDVLGRRLYPPLVPGCYFVRLGSTTFAVQMP